MGCDKKKSANAGLAYRKGIDIGREAEKSGEWVLLDNEDSFGMTRKVKRRSIETLSWMLGELRTERFFLEWVRPEVMGYSSELLLWALKIMLLEYFTHRSDLIRSILCSILPGINMQILHHLKMTTVWVHYYCFSNLKISKRITVATNVSFSF